MEGSSDMMLLQPPFFHSVSPSLATVRSRWSGFDDGNSLTLGWELLALLSLWTGLLPPLVLSIFFPIPHTRLLCLS